MIEKNLVRQEALCQRDAMPLDTRHALSEKICRRILQSDAYQNASLVLSYMPIRSEVDVLAVSEAAITNGKQLALPKVHGETMEFYAVTDLTDLIPGSFGVREPAAVSERPITPALLSETLTLVLFPGCTFSRMGDRLGYGKGYYDRYFTPLTHKKNIIKAGVSFEAQLSPAIPHTAHDLAVDLLFTEVSTISCPYSC